MVYTQDEMKSLLAAVGKEKISSKKQAAFLKELKSSKKNLSGHQFTEVLSQLGCKYPHERKKAILPALKTGKVAAMGPEALKNLAKFTGGDGGEIEDVMKEVVKSGLILEPTVGRAGVLNEYDNFFSFKTLAM